jgi:catechol 2,3-dioxygenase-like lactoylglutathione lyase family enzyme
MSHPKLFLCLAFLGSLSGAGLALPTCEAATPPSAAVEIRRSSAAIETADVDATAGWYRDKLGFRVLGERSTTHGRRVVLERSGMLLEIAERDAPAPTTVRADVETTASLPVPKLSLLVEDVDAETERLRTQGVPILEEPDDDLDGRFRTSWIRDNGGRLIELREPLAEGSGERP